MIINDNSNQSKNSKTIDSNGHFTEILDFTSDGSAINEQDIMDKNIMEDDVPEISEEINSNNNVNTNNNKNI